MGRTDPMCEICGKNKQKTSKIIVCAECMGEDLISSE
jgi:hypothetical protein